MCNKPLIRVWPKIFNFCFMTKKKLRQCQCWIMLDFQIKSSCHLYRPIDNTSIKRTMVFESANKCRYINYSSQSVINHLIKELINIKKKIYKWRLINWSGVEDVFDCSSMFKSTVPKMYLDTSRWIPQKTKLAIQSVVAKKNASNCCKNGAVLNLQLKLTV